MKLYFSQAFSLIELIVVITIIGIISLWVYSPYSHYQKKTILSQASKELSQSLSEARNLALQWRSSGSWNLHVWLFFKDTNTILYHWYPLTSTWSKTNAEILKTKKLPRGASLSKNLVWIEYFFTSISWKLSKREILPDMSFFPRNLDSVEIFEVSYQWSTAENLKKNFYYYSNSHISEF